MHGALGWPCRLCQVKSFFASGSHPSGTAFFWLGVAPVEVQDWKVCPVDFATKLARCPGLGFSRFFHFHSSLSPACDWWGLARHRRWGAPWFHLCLCWLCWVCPYLQFSSVSLPSRSSDSRGPRYEICTFTVPLSHHIFILYLYSIYIYIQYTGVLHRIALVQMRFFRTLLVQGTSWQIDPGESREPRVFFEPWTFPNMIKLGFFLMVPHWNDRNSQRKTRMQSIFPIPLCDGVFQLTFKASNLGICPQGCRRPNCLFWLPRWTHFSFRPVGGP